MRNLKSYDDYVFEQKDQEGPPVPLTTEEDITNYYKCNDCGNLYHLFNEVSNICPKCGKYNLVQLTSYDYFTELKKGDKSLYSKELKLQGDRSKNLVDLINLEYIKRNKDYRKSIN